MSDRDYFSLGTNCTLAYNLKYFGLINKSGILDNFISPYSGILWMMENKFSITSCSFKENLEKVSISNTDTIIHRPSGLIMHHAFSRDDQGRVSSYWENEIKDVYNKYKFLGERMKSMVYNSKKPIFILSFDIMSDDDKNSILEKHQSKMSKSDKILSLIIEQARYSFDKNIRFVFVDPRENCINDIKNFGGVKIESLHQYGDWHDGNPSHFGGCKRGWKELLERINDSVL